MKNFSSIIENIDVPNKQYVDDNKIKSIDGLTGGTLTSPITLTGGDEAAASKMILSSNGQITDSSTATMLGFSGGNYIVGSTSYPTTFRGKQTRPTWNSKDLALSTDIPTNYIPNTRKINNKVLSSDITLSASDVGALPSSANVVYYTSQTLTDTQKTQARTNIGAGTSNFSGSYNDLSDKPEIPDSVTIVQATGTSTTSVMSQNAVTNGLNGKLSKTDNTNIEVIGTKKATTTLGGNQLYSPNGMIFGGSAAAAGLVTRGICGVTTPGTGGACAKENLYLNYDGNNDFNAARQVIINAGSAGNNLGSNMYQYAAPRGEIVKNWVEAKGYATSVKMNGNTIASSSGVVDIGTVITSHQGIKSINTNNTAAQSVSASETVAGSGTINLHKVAKTGSYNDLLNKPTIPSVSGKLDKTTYEYNEELALSSNGKVLIGVFPMYDTNLTIHISSTTNTTYNGTLVIATQNFGTANRTILCNLYGDPTGTLYNCLVVQQNADATNPNILVYGNFAGYSKNLVHIQAVGLKAAPEELMVSTTSIPTTNLVAIHNVLNDNFAKLSADNKFTGEMTGIAHPYRVFQNEDAYTAYQSNPSSVKYTSQTYAAFIANTDANSRTAIVDGRIDNKKGGTTYQLTLPTKTGTLAVTSDIPSGLPTYSLSGTTLTITLT